MNVENVKVAFLKSHTIKLIEFSYFRPVENYSYDVSGALATKEVKSGATILFRVDYVRDSLSRIKEKTENVQGQHAYLCIFLWSNQESHFSLELCRTMISHRGT
jgi:hypothetical protein